MDVRFEEAPQDPTELRKERAPFFVTALFIRMHLARDAESAQVSLLIVSVLLAVMGGVMLFATYHQQTLRFLPSQDPSLHDFP